VFELTEKAKRILRFPCTFCIAKGEAKNNRTQNGKLCGKKAGRQASAKEAENKTSIFMRQFIAFPPLFGQQPPHLSKLLPSGERVGHVFFVFWAYLWASDYITENVNVCQPAAIRLDKVVTRYSGPCFPYF